MGRFLVFTTDLPYFPGRNGHDHFNLRELSKTHDVAVVGPEYGWFPRDGVRNLESFLKGCYWWPRSSNPGILFAMDEAIAPAARWTRLLPRLICRQIVRRALGLHDKPGDAYEKLAILSNCAPNAVEALREGGWQAFLLIQSSLEPWLEYLPSTAGKLVYFHDVRSDYFRREDPIPGRKRRSSRELRAVARQEQTVARRADVIGFVSRLDEERACQLLHPSAQTGVAPIPVDMAYFHARPVDWKPRPRAVLFTGHLSHPPNVDAVLYFLREVWPSILQQVPDAIFVVAGMLPSDEVKRAAQSTPRVELHADVPDIRPLFWDAAVYVVPMRFGGGVRQKLFEAWSIEVPVVCTSMAAEGTGAESGRHCMLADTPEDFARAVVTALSGSFPAAVRQEARTLVASSYSIQGATPKFRELAERTARVKRNRAYKLLYDLRWMELGKAGGMEQATHELIAAIAGVDDRNDYRLFAPRSAYYEWDFPASFRVKPVYSDYNGRRQEAHRAYLVNQLAARGGLPQILNRSMRTLAEFRRMDFDLVHSVCGYLQPDLDAFPSILTVHDLQHLHQPHFFTREAWEEREELYRSSVRKAQHILCISEFTRQDVHRQYGVPLDRMTTVWNIPDRHAWRLLPERERQSYLNGMGICGRYFFYPAQSWPHKNHLALLDAFEKALPDLPADVNLVLTGRPFAPSHPVAQRLLGGKLKGRVLHLGFRTPVEIRSLFQEALALVFPSLFEGFGIPLAEAMIAGTPIACSRVCSMPEVARDAALYFDPTRPEEIAAALVRLAGDSELRSQLRESGLKLCHTFSARRCALQTLSVYRQVYEDLYQL